MPTRPSLVRGSVWTAAARARRARRARPRLCARPSAHPDRHEARIPGRRPAPPRARTRGCWPRRSSVRRTPRRRLRRCCRAGEARTLDTVRSDGSPSYASVSRRSGSGSRPVSPSPWSSRTCTGEPGSGGTGSTAWSALCTETPSPSSAPSHSWPRRSLESSPISPLGCAASLPYSPVGWHDRVRHRGLSRPRPASRSTPAERRDTARPARAAFPALDSRPPARHAADGKFDEKEITGHERDTHPKGRARADRGHVRRARAGRRRLGARDRQPAGRKGEGAAAVHLVGADREGKARPRRRSS